MSSYLCYEIDIPTHTWAVLELSHEGLRVIAEFPHDLRYKAVLLKLRLNCIN
jgi:hypothetical protein